MKNKMFKKIYIEITNICNLSCEFCTPDGRKKEFIKKDKFEYILEQIKEYTDYIYLHVKGEPLLHPEINELIELAYNKGFYINITTNGTYIEKLHTKNIRQINYSMQSANDIKQMQETVRKLRKYVLNENIYLSLRLWTKKAKEDSEIREMLKKEFGDMIDIDNKNTLDKNIFLSVEDEFIWPSLENKDESQEGYCYGLKDHIAILVDGTVIPCCLDHKGNINLGNINDMKLSEILNTKKSKDIIEGFKNRNAVEELCRKCGFKNKF